MRRKTLTKPQIAEHAKLNASVAGAVDAIYALAWPRMDVRFTDCRAMANAAQLNAYETARIALDSFESEMIAECRAWRASFGMFTPY